MPSALAELLATAWSLETAGRYDEESDGDSGKINAARGVEAHTPLTLDSVDDIFEPDSVYHEAIEQAPATKNCLACTDDLPLTSFATLAHGTACNHVNDICSSCWQLWLDEQLTAGGAPTADVACAQCHNLLHQNDVQAVASPGIFDRYHRASICLLMSEDENFRWCPSGSCNSGQIHDTGSAGNIFTCTECGHKSCVDCQTEWHAGQSCAAVQEERAALEE